MRDMRADGKSDCWRRAIYAKTTLLTLCRVNGDRIACCNPILPRIFSCDLPDFPADRNRLKRIRGGESL